MVWAPLWSVAAAAVQPLSALLSWFFPVFLSVGGTYIFGFFALIALGSLIFAIKLPETKDKSLEQIQKELVK